MEQFKTTSLHFCKEFKEAFVLRYKEFGDFFKELRDSVLRAHFPGKGCCSCSVLTSELSFRLPPARSQICLRWLHFAGIHQSSPCGELDAEFLAEKEGNEAFRREKRLQDALVMHYRLVVWTALELLANGLFKGFLRRRCCVSLDTCRSCLLRVNSQQRKTPARISQIWKPPNHSSPGPLWCSPPEQSCCVPLSPAARLPSAFLTLWRHSL